MEEFTVFQSTPANMPDTRIVSMSGCMTIEHGAEIKSALQEAINAATTVQLDLEKVTEMDLIGLQLICSMHRTAVSEQKLFSVNGTNGAVIKEAARAGGFFRHVGCVLDINHTCIWAGGGK